MIKNSSQTIFRARSATPIIALIALIASSWGVAAAGRAVTVDAGKDSLTFAVIGDSGTGSSVQWEVARSMEAVHGQTSFELVLMLGDNIYGALNEKAFVEKFEKPYANLLAKGVQFYAALGNHGTALKETEYDKFNMKGRRYYTFTRGEGLAQFFAIDSTQVDSTQLEWLEKELASSRAEWKIAFFHHPIYSSARRHGSDIKLRTVLEPLFVRYGVQIVLAGHDHVYERTKPQQGIIHFVCGASGKLRENNIDRSSDMLAAGNDSEPEFMVIHIKSSALEFQAINGKGKVFDSGKIPSPVAAHPAAK